MSSSELEDLIGLMFQVHPWHGIAPYAEESTLNAYVEIVPTDAVKYELDKPSGHLRIDRPQRFSSLCPMLYGFVPQTYCGEETGARCAERCNGEGPIGDGDPLDICVLTEKTVAHGGFLARAVPIGGLRMIDGDEADDKIVAVLEADVAFGHMRDIGDCPSGVIERLQHYFLSYKQRPGESGHRVRIAEIYDRAEAHEVVARSGRDYKKKFGEPEARRRRLRELLAAL